MISGCRVACSRDQAATPFQAAAQVELRESQLCKRGMMRVGEKGEGEARPRVRGRREGARKEGGWGGRRPKSCCGNYAIPRKSTSFSRKRSH